MLTSHVLYNKISVAVNEHTHTLRFGESYEILQNIEMNERKENKKQKLNFTCVFLVTRSFLGYHQIDLDLEFDPLLHTNF